MIAILAALVLSQAQASDLSTNLRCRDRTRGWRECTSGFSLFSQFDFGTSSLPSLTTSGLVTLCRVNAGGTAWECVDSAGAAFGAVVQGSGPSFQPTPFGVFAQSDITAASSPTVASAASLDTLFKGDHTIIMAGYATSATDPTFQHWFGGGDGTRGVYYRGDSGNFICVEFEGAATVSASVTGQPVDGWAVMSCRRSGTTSTARINGTDGTGATAAAITNTLTGGTVYNIGNRNPGTTLPLRGPMAFVAIYNRALSAAEIKAIENQFWGLDSRTFLAGIGTGVQCVSPDAGPVDCFYPGASMPTPSGIRNVRGQTVTNKHAADNLATASWSAIGTPTTTTNASSGPFARWKNAAECDLVVDDDPAAFEGYEGANAFVRNGTVTAQYILKAGTSGVTQNKARIVVVSNGSPATTNCDISTLTASYATYTCQATISGATSISSRVLVGNATTDTGSITVCEGGDVPGPWEEIPTPSNTAIGNSDLRISGSDLAAVTGKGKYEVVFTPIYNPNTQWIDTSDTIYLFDSYTTVPANHSSLMIFGYTVPGRALARADNGVTNTDIAVDGIALTPFQQYVSSLEWVGTGTCSLTFRLDTCSNAATCKATTVIGTASGACPSQPDFARLGNRYDGTVPTSVFIKSFRVYR